MLWELRIVAHFLTFVIVVSVQTITGQAQPPASNGCAEGWLYYDFRCYRFVPSPRLTWPQALAWCNNTGAYLVSIETMDELNFLEKYTVQRTRQMKSLKRQQWWTGGYLDMDYYSSWVWDVPDVVPDGLTPFGLLREAWYPGEPNDENDEETYISLRFDRVGLGLDDKAGHVQMGFICEKDPIVPI